MNSTASSFNNKEIVICCLYCLLLLSIIVSTLLFLWFQNDYYNRPNAPNTIPLRWLAPEGLVIQEDGVLVSKPPSSEGNVWWVAFDKQVTVLSWVQGTRTVVKTFLKKWIHAVSNFVALIPCRSIFQMLGFFFFTCLHVLQQTWD